jgi:hypothetical protein
MLLGTVTRRERVNERPGRLERVPSSIYPTPPLAPFMCKFIREFRTGLSWVTGLSIIHYGDITLHIRDVIIEQLS